jgi:hypothetical protein
MRFQYLCRIQKGSCFSNGLTLLAYLSYIFARIKKFNISIQGLDHTVRGLTHKETAFKGKRILWKSKVKGKRQRPCVIKPASGRRICLISCRKKCYRGTLGRTNSGIRQLHPGGCDYVQLGVTPFDTDVEDLADDISSITGLQEQFIEI